MPVGEVTLISVSQSPITSMPANSSPRSRSAGPSRWQISLLALGQVGRRRRTAAHHVGAQVVGGRNAVDRAGELAVHQQDALVALLHRGQEFLHHPLLAEGDSEHVVERAEIEIVARDAEHRAAAMAVKRLHHDVAVLGAERLDLGEVAGNQRRRHQVGKFGDQHLFRRVAHMRRVVDHQRLGVDALEQMGGGHISEVEGRVLAQQDHVELGQLHAPRLIEREMVAGLVAHAQSSRPWRTAGR